MSNGFSTRCARAFDARCKRAKRMLREERAGTAVEFALVSVPFLGLLFAIIETAFVFFNAEILDQATADISRQIMVGSLQLSNAANKVSPSDAQTNFQNMVCPTSGPRPSTALPSNFNCANVKIAVTPYVFASQATSTSTSVTTADVSNDLFASSSNTFTLAPPGGINVVRIAYPLPAILPIVTGLGASSTQTMRAGQTQITTNGAWNHMIMGIAAFVTEPYS